MENVIKRNFIKLVKSDEYGADIFKIKFENNDLIINYDLYNISSFIEEKHFKMLTSSELEIIEEQTPIFCVELLKNVIVDSECINYPEVCLADVLLYKEQSNNKKYRKK